MNYLFLIIIGGLGVWLGFALARRSRNTILVRSEKKAKNKEQILVFLKENEKIKNNDIEKLLNVSDSTATRYLDELEKEEKIKQIGKTGQGVFYILK